MIETVAFIIGVTLAFAGGVVVGYGKHHKDYTAAMRWVESFGINPVGRLVVAKYERHVFDQLVIGDNYVVALAIENIKMGDVVAIWERVSQTEPSRGKGATSP